MKLIINADDFGYCDERNRGILELHLRSAITDTSLLVNASATESAVRLIKENGIPVGLHLNLTEGLPVGTTSDCFDLTGNDGRFLGKFGFREAYNKGLIPNSAIEAEMRAQLTRFRLLVGAYPLHVDGHQHVHIIPGVREVFAGVLEELNIRCTRLPAEMDVGSCSWLAAESLAFREEVARLAQESAQTFSKSGIRYPDAFVGMRVMGAAMTAERVLGQLLACRAASGDGRGKRITCEWMVHPGYRSRTGAGGCDGAGPDDFSLSWEREHEMAVLASDELSAGLEAAGVEKCSYRCLASE